MKILVTGSQTWSEEKTVWGALDDAAAPALLAGDQVTVIHGAAPGADMFADNWAHHHINLRRCGHSDYLVTVRSFPVDRRTPVGARGVFRNIAMVAHRPDVCLAFINSDSRGARHCAGYAEEQGITVKRFFE